MKRSFSLLATALLVLLAAGLASRPGTAQERGDGGEKTPLQMNMRNVMRLTKELRGSLADPAFRDASLGQIAELQAALLAAKQETPSRAAKHEGEDHQEFVDAYRRQMILMLTATLELEEMVLDEEDVEELQAKLKSLGDIKNIGHDRFK